jgi:hypothetical protein
MRSNKSKSRYATIFDGPVAFPNTCPFTGKPSPEGSIKLHRTTDRATLIPLLGLSMNFISHTFRRSQIEVPADRGLCHCIRLLDVIFAIAVVLGPCVAAIWIMLEMMRMENRPLTAPVALFIGATTLAAVSLLYRAWLLRNVRLVGHAERRITLRFHSEDYAREFASMNRCSLEARPTL